MKISGLIFIGLIILIALKYTKVFPEITLWMIAVIFCLWLIVVYIQIHLKNKDKNTPRPVYMAE